jgi:hypothetical protein
MRHKVIGMSVVIGLIVTLLALAKEAPAPATIKVVAPTLPAVTARCTKGVIEVNFSDKSSEWLKVAGKTCGSSPTPPVGQRWICDKSCTDSHGCTWCCEGHYTKGDVRRYD